MFECRLSKAEVLKKVMDALKDLIKEGVWDVTCESFSLQSMDSSHVSLVQVELKSDGFESFRCDKNLALGGKAVFTSSSLIFSVNMDTMQKLMKCSANDDVLTIKAEDDGDLMTILFESQVLSTLRLFSDVSFSERRQDIGIRDEAYGSRHRAARNPWSGLQVVTSSIKFVVSDNFSCVVKMPSGEFQRICRDLSNIGESVNITIVKSGVDFSAKGDIGSAKIHLTESANVDKEKDAVTIEVNEPVNLTFALR